MNPTLKIFLLFLYCFIFCRVGSYCQVNLVPNPDFEEYYYCPDTIGNLIYGVPAAPDPCPKYWYDPTWSTSDYFNSCSTLPEESGVPQNYYGLQNPHSGNGYCGFGASFTPGTWFQEYIAIPLSSPLGAGQTYYVSFWLSLADSICYANNMIGAYFSPDTIDTAGMTGSLIYEVPQIKFTQIITDKANWTLMKQSFIAAGGEKYMAIGVFDTTAIDTAFVPTNCYYPTTYIIYYYIDDVVVSTQPDVSVDPENYGAIKLHQNYPNPFYDNTVITYFLMENIKCAQLIFRNNLGQIIKVIDINERGEGILNLDGKDFRKGMYSYNLIVDGFVYEGKKMIKE